MKANMRVGFVLLTALLSACKVGPDYVPPHTAACLAPKYKEVDHRKWKLANPQDAYNRGMWWKIFKDPQLNCLEIQLNRSNQSVITAYYNFKTAQALVDEARANYWPALSFTGNTSRQRGGGTAGFVSTTSSAATGTSSTSTGSISSTGGGSRVTSTHSMDLSATWEADIWGAIARQVEVNASAAQASAALLAATRLSTQASLAVYYFELRGADIDQKLLNDTVKNYKAALKLTQNQYKQGVAGESDVVQAQSQLQSAQALAVNIGIARAQYEHAIAVIVGAAPESFAIKAHPHMLTVPSVPIEVPSELLERRPDIAQAERTMKEANANIGVAISAYFPVVNLTGSLSRSGQGLSRWFSLPVSGWSFGAQIADEITDGGLRAATVRAARATYHADVATYRQTVLAALQDVEDNMVSVRLLVDQARYQKAAAISARKALNITLNQYKAGTVAYTNVITAQTTDFNAQKAAADVTYIQLTSAVGLIRALGGGWDTDTIVNAAG